MSTGERLRQVMCDAGDGVRLDLCLRATASGDAWRVMRLVQQDPNCDGYQHVIMVLAADDPEAADWIQAGIDTGGMSGAEVHQHFADQKRRGIPQHIVAAWPAIMAMQCVVEQCSDPAALELARGTLERPDWALICILAGHGVMVTRAPLEMLRQRSLYLTADNQVHGQLTGDTPVPPGRG